MKGFEPVTLSWDGTDYTVPPNEQLMLIAELEYIISGADTHQTIPTLLKPTGPPTPILSKAYAHALRAAGADVTGDEIYLSIQEDLAAGGSELVYEKVQGAVMDLIMIISPPLGREIAGQTIKKPDPAEKAQPAEKD